MSSQHSICSVTSCMFYELFEESKHALFNVVSKDHTAIHLRNTTLIEKYNYSKSQLESLPVDCTPFNGGECSIDSKFTFFFFVICLPTKHLRVLSNSFKHICAFEIELDFGSFGFWGKGKSRVLRQKPLRAKGRTNNKLNPRMASMPGFKPGPHWGEGSALATALPLLSLNNMRCDCLVEGELLYIDVWLF